MVFAPGSRAWLFALAGVLLSFASQAQLVVSSRQPARNATAVPRNAAVAVGFSQPVSAATAPTMRVYGALRQGRRLGSVAGGGTASLTFAPNLAFAPGEVLSVSLPPTLLSTTGTAATQQVYQFVAATGGAGRGFFADTTIVGNTGSRDQLLGDLDGDGDLDLVTTGALYGCRIFLNDGTGQYTFKTGLVTGQTPGGATLADVDGDGDLDLLAGDATNSTVSICRNDGLANFNDAVTGAQNALVGSQPVSIAAGDVDGDGDLDFVTANAANSSSTTWLNTGGTPLLFTSSRVVGMGAGPTNVALADVDNDGNLDLLTTNPSASGTGPGEVHVALNLGGGYFGAYATVLVGSQPTELQAADIDGDGDLDLLVANAGSASVSVRLNNGSGIFGGTTTLALPAGSTPTGLRTGDVDADGDLDLLVAQGLGGRVYTYLNTAGTFAVQGRPLRLRYGAAPQTVGVTLGDVDGDLDLDLITSDTDGNVRLSLNVGALLPLPVPAISSLSPATGPVGTPVTIAGANLLDVTSVFFNGTPAPGYVPNGQGTGLTVTVPPGATTGTVTVVTDAAGTATAPAPFTVTIPVPVLLTSIVPARNARSAPLASNVVAAFSAPITAATAGNVRVFGSQRRGRRAGTITGAGTNTITFDPNQDFAPGEQVSVSLPNSLQTLDGNRVTRQVVQFTAAAGGSGRHDFNTTSTMNVAGTYTGQVGDFDNDGDPDLAVPDYYAGVQLYFNNGAGTYTSGPTLAVATARSVSIGDIDSDGDLDLVVNTYNSNYQLWLNNGSGTFTNSATVVGAYQPVLTALADVDADGDLDLLSSRGFSVDVLFNNGTGQFGGIRNSLLSISGTSLALGDVDNDGDLDLLVCGTLSSSLSGVGVHLNDGTGTFSTALLPFTYNTSNMALGDVDADGDLDLALSTDYQNQIVVLANPGNGLFASAMRLATLPVAGLSLALADTDADGDLDVVTFAAVALNNGSGAFPQVVTTTGGNPTSTTPPTWLTLADVDGDLDLDLLANDGTNLIRVKLNRPGPPPLLSDMTPASGPVGSSVLLTGINLPLTTGVSFGGVAATAFTIISATKVVATVPAGAASGPIVLTAAGGIAPTPASFTVTQPLAVAALSPARQALGVARTAAVSVTLARPVSAATAAELRVFGQRRGRLAGTVAGGGTATLTFTPSQPLAAGEVISVNIPDRVTGLDGSRAVRQGSQFGVAAAGTGTGLLLLPGAAGRTLAAVNSRYGYAVGDLDQDGDLDVLNTEGQIHLNDGQGAFPDSTSLGLLVSINPRNVALGDLDSDGDLDLVSSSGQIYSAVGPLTFAQQSGLAGLGDDNRDLALGDIDSDGDLDMLTPNYARDSVFVFFNDGYGAFLTQLRVPVGHHPTGISLGDVDGDGDLDFITANEGTSAGSSLSIGFNNGIGWFGNVQQVAAGTGLSRVALGDLDADGDLDLVTSNGLVRVNNGAGTFGGTQTTPTGQGVALADLDADGDLDLVVTGAGPAALRRNDGTGQFSGTETVDLGPGNLSHDPLLADLDGDGDLDLLTANTTNATVQISLNQRLAAPVLLSFSPASDLPGATIVLTGRDFIGTTSVTFNGVAAPDFTVVTASRIEVHVPAGATSGLLQITNNKGTTTSATAFTVLQPVVVAGLSPARNAVVPTSSAVAVTFSQPVPTNTPANLAVFSQQRGGRLAGGRRGAGTATLSLLPAQPFAPGEILRVSVPAYTNANLSRVRPQVYELRAAVGGSGRGTFSPPTGLAYGGTNLVLGDADGDGDLDLVGSSGRLVQLQRNDGLGNFGTPTTLLTYALGSQPAASALGDIDGDGDLDLVATEAYASPLTTPAVVNVRLNDGAGNFSGTQSVPAGSDPTRIALADLDADGDLDILVTGAFYTYQPTSTYSVRLNDGTGQFGPGRDERLYGSSVYLAAPILGDIDGDGDLDMLTNNPASPVRLNDGFGHFAASPTQVTLYYDTTSLALGDADGDGDLDIITVRVNYGILVYVNNGQGVFTSGANGIASSFGILFGGFDTFTAGDFDADGDLDLFLGGSQLNKALVMTNNGQGSFALGQVTSNAYGPMYPLSADLDGDGDLDILMGGGVATWFNGGHGQPLAAATAQPAAPLAAVYPNPAHGQFIVKIPTELRPAATQATPLRLYNSVGQLVLEQPLTLAPSGELTVPVAHLPAGIYTLHLALRSGPSTYKIAVY